MSNTITITEAVLEKFDKDRLVELMFIHELPKSQAIAFHLISDLSYRPCDAARLVGVSQVAITDAVSKAKRKLKVTA